MGRASLAASASSSGVSVLAEVISPTSSSDHWRPTIGGSCPPSPSGVGAATVTAVSSLSVSPYGTKPPIIGGVVPSPTAGVNVAATLGALQVLEPGGSPPVQKTSLAFPDMVAMVRYGTLDVLRSGLAIFREHSP